MKQGFFNTIFIFSGVNIILLLFIVFKVLKHGLEIVFYSVGFYIPAILSLILIGLILANRDCRKRNWLVLGINLVSLVIAFMYLQERLMVK